MSENLTSPKGISAKLSWSTGIIFILLTFTSSLTTITGISSGTLISSLSTGIIGTLFTTFFFYAFLMSLNDKGNKGALLIILPVVFTAILGFAFSKNETALYIILETISACIVAAFLYRNAREKKSRAEACAVIAFVFTVFSIFELALSLLILSGSINVSITTLLFDGIEDLINISVTLFTDALGKAGQINPAYALSASEISMNLEYFETQLVLTIALLPAIIYISLFFVAFLFTYVSDCLCRIFGIIGENVFGKFTVSTVSHVLFNILGFVVVFSLLFEESTSPFSCGVLSALLALLPNYIILGFRRVFGIFEKRMSKVGAVFAIIIASVIGLYLSATLLLFIIVIFGTSEYRICKHGSVVK